MLTDCFMKKKIYASTAYHQGHVGVNAEPNQFGVFYPIHLYLSFSDICIKTDLRSPVKKDYSFGHSRT